MVIPFQYRMNRNHCGIGSNLLRSIEWALTVSQHESDSFVIEANVNLLLFFTFPHPTAFNRVLVRRIPKRAQNTTQKNEILENIFVVRKDLPLDIRFEPVL